VETLQISYFISDMNDKNDTCRFKSLFIPLEIKKTIVGVVVLVGLGASDVKQEVRATAYG